MTAAPSTGEPSKPTPIAQDERAALMDAIRKEWPPLVESQIARLADPDGMLWWAWNRRAALAPPPSGAVPELPEAWISHHFAGSTVIGFAPDQMQDFWRQGYAAGLAATHPPTATPTDTAADVQHGMRLARDCAHKLANEANWHSLEAHLRKMAGLRDEDRKS